MCHVFQCWGHLVSQVKSVTRFAVCYLLVQSRSPLHTARRMATVFLALQRVQVLLALLTEQQVREADIQL